MLQGLVSRLQTKLQTLYPMSPLRDGWWALVREPFTGAWQANQELRIETVLSYAPVFACVTLIASDIAKLCLRLVQEDDDGIWTETETAAFSPFLNKPNRYQTTQQFIEQWMHSKLIHGNTYVLKDRDGRGIMIAGYVLDPTRVKPLVATDGSVYYELQRDDLSGLPLNTVTVPASEIIHDTMSPFFHPLIGITPIFACRMSAQQGLTIQQTSNALFANGSNPGGVLSAPGKISDATAARLKAYWDTNYGSGGANVGKVAVLGDDLKYQPMSIKATDAQLIDQFKLTGEFICTAYHVPAYMIGIGPPPPYANIEPLVQGYYNGCLQEKIRKVEDLLGAGMGLPKPYGLEFDTDDLIWMDTDTRHKAASDAVRSGVLSPNEARKKYYGLGKVPGGDTPYMQQQQFSLAALQARDKDPNLVSRLSSGAGLFDAPIVEAEDVSYPDDLSLTAAALHMKMLEAGF